MNQSAIVPRIVEIHFEESPLVRIRPLLRPAAARPGRREGFWFRQWRKFSRWLW